MKVTFRTEKVFELNNEVIKFILLSYVELLDRSLSGMGIPFANTDDVLMATNEKGDLTGCIVLRRTNDAIPTYWVILTAVKQGFRGKGLHKQMHSRLDAIARANGIQYISSYVSPNNKESLRAYEKFGAEQAMIKINRKVS